jgi:hypothetical protein
MRAEAEPGFRLVFLRLADASKFEAELQERSFRHASHVHLATYLHPHYLTERRI